jgi:hypothetical protein
VRSQSIIFLSNSESYLARIWPNLENHSSGEAEPYDAELRHIRLGRDRRNGRFNAANCAMLAVCRYFGVDPPVR